MNLYFSDLPICCARFRTLLSPTSHSDLGCLVASRVQFKDKRGSNRRLGVIYVTLSAYDIVGNQRTGRS